ncbi:hypothetical protein [Bacillus sp. 1P06AnD]|uniref:hypothetical protein n=1 Tax=Bacillus sp. 1P06AnD TaxID=3132208 RepID=UPI0039A07CC1
MMMDAKVIPTAYGLETYIDKLENVKIVDVRVPDGQFDSYRVKFGIEYYLLRERKDPNEPHDYEMQMNYFWISFQPDMSHIEILEPVTESLFAVKNKAERTATKHLISNWIMQSNAFKQNIKEYMNECEQQTEGQSELIKIFEKLLEMNADEIENAPLIQCS